MQRLEFSVIEIEILDTDFGFSIFVVLNIILIYLKIFSEIVLK
jgi:hypothetical protein